MNKPSRPMRRRLVASVIAILSLTVAFTVTTVASASPATTQATALAASERIAKPIKPTKTTSSPPASTTSSQTSASALPATPTSPTTPPPTCSSGSAPVAFSGQWYCPGYVIGVRNTAYGIGTRIVLAGYVTQVVGTDVTVEGGPSCLPGAICGQTIPSVIIKFGGLATMPRYGDVLTVYGMTEPSTMTATGYKVTGYYDPYFG